MPNWQTPSGSQPGERPADRITLAAGYGWLSHTRSGAVVLRNRSLGPGRDLMERTFERFQTHTAQDTLDKIDYDRLARVVAPLTEVIAELAGVAEKDEGRRQKDE